MEKSNKLFCVFINRHIIKKKVIIIISRIKSVIWVVIYIIGFIKKEFFIFIVMGCIYTAGKMLRHVKQKSGATAQQRA